MQAPTNKQNPFFLLVLFSWSDSESIYLCSNMYNSYTCIVTHVIMINHFTNCLSHAAMFSTHNTGFKTGKTLLGIPRRDRCHRQKKQTKQPKISIVEQMGVYVDNSINFIRQVAMCSYSPHKFLQFLDTNVLESD